MKKTIFGLLSMAVLLFATSCLKEDVISQSTGDEVTVSFTTEWRTTPKTKAVGDNAESIDNLEVAVFQVGTDGAGNETLTYLPDVVQTIGTFADDADGKRKVTANIVLVKGQTYRFAFWAQDGAYSAYVFDPATATVIIDTDNVLANTRSGDAFYASTANIKVEESFAMGVTMTRPFAQVNFLTSATDLENAKKAGFVPAESSIKVANVANKFNVLTGTVEGSMEATFKTNDLLTNATGLESTTIGTDTYYYLATSYILPTDLTDKVKIDATMNVEDSAPIKAENIDAQKNYRTNIYGDLLTAAGTFNVDLAPGFAEDEYNVERGGEAVAPGVVYYEKTSTFKVSAAKGLAWISSELNNGDSKYEFDGETTIALDADIDLSLIDDTVLESDEDKYEANNKLGNSNPPIGATPVFDADGKLTGLEVTPFTGTFDGNGHTIKNLYQSGWDLAYDWDHYGSIGLFAELENATVKNVVIEGLEAQVEGGDISFIAGSATGDCVFENITIKNSKIGTYNNGCGGIIGWSGAGTYTFKNIKIDSDVVLGGLWGSFDSSIGGIVGQAEPGATYNFENVEINCRIDAYNDCTASYDYYNYRMCGMIIGRCAKTTTIDGANYPDLAQYNMSFKNVVVNYGNWMNYHYCRKSGERAVRVEPGYAYGGVAADRDHTSDDVHCMECIPFDQLIGGAQYGVKGLKAVDGVTVNYPGN